MWQCGVPAAGGPNPVLVIVEEAHRYLGDESAEVARDSANRIAREGRKSDARDPASQRAVGYRPGSVRHPDLAPVSNQADQAKIRSVLPDSVVGLDAVLPSLCTGGAVISGETVVLPSRFLIRRLAPLAKAEDPSLAPWRAAKQPAELDQALAAWREAYEQ